MEITPIAYIRNDFPTKFGIPRQSGMCSLVSRVVFTKDYAKEEAFRGLDGFDYVWLIWGFDRAEKTDALTVRPPRLGGNVRVGVFATRSPYRPNGLGLSSVKIVDKSYTQDGFVLYVSGADMADGTPVYDVKPYLPYCDSHPDALGGFGAAHLSHRLRVEYAPGVLDAFPEDKRAALTEILALDPRPSYQEDGREYGFAFCGKEIRFSVSDGVLTVTSVQ